MRTLPLTTRGAPVIVYGRDWSTVTFSHSGQTLEIPGAQLLQDGIPVRLEANLTSELLIFRAK